MRSAGEETRIYVFFLCFADRAASQCIYLSNQPT